MMSDVLKSRNEAPALGLLETENLKQPDTLSSALSRGQEPKP